MNPFEGPAPRWFTIPAHRPFLQDLARGLHDALAANGPEGLADAVVLVPNRRAGRSLAEAFTAVAGGGALLLPQIRPLGDLEENEAPFEPGELALDLPPAIGPLARRFELARLVSLHRPDVSPLEALETADALGRFLDSCIIEEVEDPARVETLVEADMAEHWRASSALLTLVVRDWPARLKELGLVDLAERRVRLLDRLAESWDARPPKHPLVAAGSTGTVPAARRVLGVAAGAPQGCVVLPGLDLDLADDAWAAVDHQHPQGAMKRLLADNRIPRASVKLWGGVERRSDAARRRLVAHALKPPPATRDWRAVIEEMETLPEHPVDEGLRGLWSLSGRSEEQAAATAAALMREVLEEPGKTCALVTPDPLFARRVQARLSRWGVEADSSAGDPLAQTRAGRLLALTADVAAEPFSAATLLGLLKHPLTGFGCDAATLHRRTRALERRGLRGPRPQGFEAVAARLEKARTAAEADGRDVEAMDEAAALFASVRAALEPWLDAMTRPQTIVAAARALAEALERMAEGEAAAASLWSGPDGEAAARLLGELIDEGAALPPLDAACFARVLRDLMTVEVVRTGGDTHPRLRILGAVEARLMRADRMILAGVEEGVWPRLPPIDPFLSRPMRETLGLPPPERRIGLQAHDFAQAACAPEVFLLHTERRGGQPQVKSRWLWRLETLVGGAGRTLPDRPEVAAFAAAVDAADPAPPPSLEPAERPEPKPPVALRPRAMSVTRVEEWVRDPYATYARSILGLKRIDQPDEQVDARLRGTAIHAALERFTLTWPELDPAEAARVFAGYYIEELVKGGMPAAALAREATLAANAGAWAARFEAERRADGAQILVERQGTLEIPARRAPFRLSARADRLEVRGGRLVVVDYKTGGAPSKRQVKTGFSPQLPLTAAIAAGGGFADLPPSQPDSLLYVSVTGRIPPARVEDRTGEDGAAAAAEEALGGLIELIELYEDPARGYASRTAPQFAQRAVSDYDHLARVREWSVAEDEEE